jgi:hypothetical protein
MNILLILHGHYRTFDKTHISWVNSFEGCTVDYKFCTFDTIDHNTKCWHRDRTELKPKLSNAQINLLKSFDPTVNIITQTFTNDESNDIYATLPLKVYLYKYNNIKSILETTDTSKYDMIIISRFDIIIYNIKFINTTILKNEVNLGVRPDNRFLNNIAATDLLYMFHPSDKSLFYAMPSDIINRKFSLPEECYTEFFYNKFKKVNHTWNFNENFSICHQ